MKIKWNKKKALVAILATTVRSQVFKKSSNQFGLENFYMSSKHYEKIEINGIKKLDTFDNLFSSLIAKLPEVYSNNKIFMEGFYKSKDICFEYDLKGIINQEDIFFLKNYISLLYRDNEDSSSELQVIFQRIDEICSDEIKESIETDKIIRLCRKQNIQHELNFQKETMPMYREKYNIKYTLERFRNQIIEIDLIAMTEKNEIIIFEYKYRKSERVISQLIHSIAYVKSHLDLISAAFDVKIENPTFLGVCACRTITEEMRVTALMCKVPIQIDKF